MAAIGGPRHPNQRLSRALGSNPRACQVRPKVVASLGPTEAAGLGGAASMQTPAAVNLEPSAGRCLPSKLPGSAGLGPILPPAGRASAGVGLSQGLSCTPRPCGPLGPCPPHPAPCWLVAKLTPWQWAYLLIATDGPPPPRPAHGSQAPKCPNQPILCPELVSQGPLSPKNVPRCEFPREGAGLAQSLGPCPLPSPRGVGAGLSAVPRGCWGHPPFPGTDPDVLD